MSGLKYYEMKRTEHDLKLFHQFLIVNGWRRDYELIKWQYYNHPMQQIYRMFARDNTDNNGEGKIVAGYYGVVSEYFKVGDNNGVAVVSVDTLTSPAYRRRGLYSKMASSVYHRCESEGVVLVYGFPNQNSAPTFFNRLGWFSFGQTPILSKPLRMSCFFRLMKAPNRMISMLSRFKVCSLSLPELGASQEIKYVNNFNDKQFDALWHRFSSTIPLAIHRNRAYLNWRLIDKPGLNYQTLSFIEKGELKGFVSYGVLQKKRGKPGYILELIYEPNEHYIGEALLDHAISKIFLAGGEYVNALNLSHSPNHAAFKKKKFYYVPKIIRIGECYFGARKFKAAGEIEVYKLSNWYISYCDSDTE